MWLTTAHGISTKRVTLARTFDMGAGFYYDH